VGGGLVILRDWARRIVRVAPGATAGPRRENSSRRNVGVDTSYVIRYFVAHHARDMITCNVLSRRDAVFGVLKVGDASGSGANGQQG